MQDGIKEGNRTYDTHNNEEIIHAHRTADLRHYMDNEKGIYARHIAIHK
jgi:hypothetical protein